VKGEPSDAAAGKGIRHDRPVGFQQQDSGLVRLRVRGVWDKRIGTWSDHVEGREVASPDLNPGKLCRVMKPRWIAEGQCGCV